MIKKGSFSGNFLILLSGNTVAQVVPFFFIPIITRLFLEEEIAVRANFLALAGMISIVAGGRYETAIVLPSDKGKAMNLFAIASKITLVISALCLVFYFFPGVVDAFYGDTENSVYRTSDYLILLVLAVPLYSFYNIYRQWLIREKKYRSLTSSGIALAAFGNLFAVAFGYMSYGITGLIWSMLIGLLVSIVLMVIASQSTMNFSLLNRKEQGALVREYKDFPLINAPHAFTDALFTQFILFAIITREFGLGNLAYFVSMSTVLMASMKAVGGAVGQLYYKEASDLHASGKDVFPMLVRSVTMVLIFAVPACLVVLFFGPQLFSWYLGANYVKSGELAQIMIIPIFINFVVSPISSTPIIYRRQGWAFVFSLSGYLLGIGAILAGNYQGLDFYETITLYAILQGIYYLWLLGWYIKLTRSRI